MQKMIVVTPISFCDFTVEITDFTEKTLLDQLQQHAGGYVERLDTVIPAETHNIFYPKYGMLDLWLNEEGLMLQMLPNKLATFLWRETGKTYNNPIVRETNDRSKSKQTLVGTTIITGGSTKEGKTRGLSDTKIDWIHRVTHMLLNM